MSKQLTLKIPFLAHGVAARDVVTVVVGRDNSFYCRLERPNGAPWRVPRVTPSANSTEGIVDFVNFEERSFALNKISFHPSGVIHQTDTAGRRFKDGIRGPSFDEMELPYALCEFYPCELSQFAIFERRRRWYHVAMIDLKDHLVPFGLKFWVVDRDHQLAAPSQTFWVGPFNFNFEDLKYGLAITVSEVPEMVRPEPPPWPPFPFMIFRHNPSTEQVPPLIEG